MYLRLKCLCFASAEPNVFTLLLPAKTAAYLLVNARNTGSWNGSSTSKKR